MDRDLEKKIFLLLGAYFLLQLIIRLLVSPSLELDEAEQLLLTQQPSLGYGSQPPLYTWLLSGLFHLFGVHIFSLALLKNLLLFCTYVLVYRCARSQGFGIPASAATMLSLFFIPQIAWESQRDLTHSVLVTTLTAATIFCWMRLRQDQSNANFVLVGLCWGMGLLGKYNFGIFLVSLLAASLTIAEYRNLILTPRIMLSVTTMLTVVAPHVIWAATHLPLLMTSSGKFKQAARGSYLLSITQGVGSLVLAALAFSAPILIIYLFVRYWNRAALHADISVVQLRPLAPNLLLHCILFSMAVCLFMVFAFQVTVFKDRWMQPLLFFLPLALLPAMESALTYKRARLIRVLAGLSAVLVLVGLSLRAIAAPYTGSVTRFNMPYIELVSQLTAQVKLADIILAENSLLGGNLKLQYPSVPVAITGGAGLFHARQPDSILVVWQDTSNWKQNENLVALVNKMVGDMVSETTYSKVQTQFRFVPAKTMSVFSALISRKTPTANHK